MTALSQSAVLVDVAPGDPVAAFGGSVATGLVDVSSDPAVLDGTGWWAVVQDYEGTFVAARFADVRPGVMVGGLWRGPEPSAWTSSLDRDAYVAGVSWLRDAIAAGTVYQANLCRVLSAPLPEGGATDVTGLHRLLAEGNPAPYAGVIRLPSGCHPSAPESGVAVATASPELFLSREGDVVRSSPIKGTGRTPEDLQDKDVAENVMIVDLVRNDLGRVCVTGSVTVPTLLGIEHHPGLVHLVSTVAGRLRPDVGWRDLLAATFPPGSVTGAPKSSALRLLTALETVPRGPYCGAVGWVDADSRTAALAVGIRTFWVDDAAAADGASGPVVRFGTGAGITWGSHPVAEWEETRLKASRLLTVASGRWPGST